MEKEKNIEEVCNEKVFDSELLHIIITDFWDFEDENGIAISGPYGVDIDIKGFNSPKNPNIKNINCLSKSFNDYDKALAYLYIRLKTFEKSLQEELSYFKDLLINEEYKGIKDSSNDKDFIYKFTKWSSSIKSSICNLKKYDDELNCKFTPLITIDGASFRANGNKDYAIKERKRLKGMTDWFFLMKTYSNNCEQALRSLVTFLDDSIEDIKPVFEWILNLYNGRFNLESGKNDNKILSVKSSQYSYNKIPQPIESESTFIIKKDEWSDENTRFDEDWESEDIPF